MADQTPLVIPPTPSTPPVFSLPAMPVPTGDADKDALMVVTWLSQAMTLMNVTMSAAAGNVASYSQANITPGIRDLNGILTVISNMTSQLDSALSAAQANFERDRGKAVAPEASDFQAISDASAKLNEWLGVFTPPDRGNIASAQAKLDNLVAPDADSGLAFALGDIAAANTKAEAIPDSLDLDAPEAYSGMVPDAGKVIFTPHEVQANLDAKPPAADGVIFTPHEIAAALADDAPIPSITPVGREFTGQTPEASIGNIATGEVSTSPDIDSYLATIAGAAPSIANVPLPPDASFSDTVAFTMPDAPTVAFPDAPAEKTFEFPPPPTVSMPSLPDAPSFELGEMPALSDIILPTRPEIDLPVWDAVKPEFDLVVPDVGIDFSEPGFVNATLEKMRGVLEHILDAPGEFHADETATWERAQDRARWELDDSMNQIAADFGARGFVFPPGAMAKAVEKARLEARKQLGELNREIAARSVDRLLGERRFAIEQGGNIVRIDFDAYRDYQERALRVMTATVDATISLFNAQVQAVGMRLEAWKTEAGIFEARLRAEISRLDAYRTEMEAVRIQTDVDKARIDAYIATTNAMRAVVDIYNAQVGAAKVAAEMEQLKVELFRAEVGAVGDQIQAYTAQIGAYEARIRGEASKLSAWETQIRGETANTQGQREALQGNIAIYQARLAGYSAQLDAFKATLPVSDAVIKAALSGIDGRMKQFDAEVMRFRASLDRDKVVVDTDAARVRANLDRFSADIRAFEAKLRSDEAKTEAEKSAYQAELSGFQAKIDKFKAALTLDEAQIRASTVALDAKAKEHDAGLRTFGAEVDRFNALLRKDEAVIRAADAALDGRVKEYDAELKKFSADADRYKIGLETTRMGNEVAERKADFQVKAAGQAVDANLRMASARLDLTRQEYGIYAEKNKLGMDRVRMEYEALLDGWKELSIMAQAGESDVRANAAALEAKTKAYSDMIAAASEAYKNSVDPQKTAIDVALRSGNNHLELLKVQLMAAQDLIHVRKDANSDLGKLYATMVTGAMSTLNTMIHYT